MGNDFCGCGKMPCPSSETHIVNNILSYNNYLFILVPEKR
jgi:hypothetical protein